MEVRGGLPVVERITVDTTGEGRIPPMVTKWVQVSNEGANALRIFFTSADFDAAEGYIELAASTGFYEGPAEIGVGGPNGRDKLWLKGVGGDADVVLVWYLRRG